MMKFGLSVFMCLGFLLSCTPSPRQETFNAPGSAYVFETTKFNDPETLVEIHGQKFSRSQIFDQSKILRNLNHQEQSLVFAMLIQKSLKDDVSVAVGRRQNFQVVTNIKRMEPEQILRFLTPDERDRAAIEVFFLAQGPQFVRWNDREYRREHLNLDDSRLQHIQLAHFKEQIRELSRQITRILISQEAQKDGSDLKTFMERVVLKGGRKISNQKAAEEWVVKEVMSEPLKVAIKPPRAFLNSEIENASEPLFHSLKSTFKNLFSL